MVWLIVRIQENLFNEVLRALSTISHISVKGVNDNQIALALDTDDINVLTRMTNEIQTINGVIGVYPIFSKDSLPFSL